MSVGGSISRGFKQTITYWQPADTPYDQYGDQSFKTPVGVTARYEQRTELFMLKTGDQSQSRAIVYASAAFQVDGYILLGTNTAGNPQTVTGADKIRMVHGVPDGKAVTTLFKAYL